MAKVVIVEGVDRVGKTTFIDKFVEAYPGFKRFKHKQSDFGYGNMDNVNETDKMLQLLEMVKLLDGNVIFDRFHLSNAIYGYLDRDYDIKQVTKSLETIENRMMDLFGDDNLLLVYVKPEDIIRSSVEHGKDLTDYDEFMDLVVIGSILPVMVGSYSLIDPMVEAVEEFFFDGIGE